MSERQRTAGDLPPLTHPDKLYFPKPKITKAGLAAYYRSVADRILPHLSGRLVSLMRCPDGVDGERFFQRHPMPGMAPAIGRVPVTEADGAREEYLRIDDLAGVQAAVQLGALELHIWGSHAERLEHPDRLVLDLDPAEGMDFAPVRAAAFAVRNLLDEHGLTSFPLLTGGRGVHVVAPLAPAPSWSAIAGFARAIADRLSENAPDRYTANSRKAGRGGRIFVDWLRNQRGATAIAPWSTRAKPDAPIAAPVGWDRLRRIRRADAIGVKTVGKLLQDDPWPGYFRLRQALPEAAVLKRTDGSMG